MAISSRRDWGTVPLYRTLENPHKDMEEEKTYAVTALRRAVPHRKLLSPKSSPGIAISIPAVALPTVVCCAAQSTLCQHLSPLYVHTLYIPLTMYPWKSNSFFNNPVSKASFSQAYVLLNLLYEHITDVTLAFTASAKGQRYNCNIY